MVLRFKQPENLVKRIADTKHGELLYQGTLRPAKVFDKDKLYPLGGLIKLGDRGNLTFTLQMRFKNYLKVDGDSKLITFMEQNQGIEIGGIRSFRTGAAEQLIKRAIIIAHFREVKYLYLDTQNRRLENIVMNLGFVLLGPNILGQRVYVKLI